MTDVTLTAAMRANLLSLQQTSKLMGITQNRLATGKAVNSALDGPINYFAAQSLSNRANDISALLDGMGQAIQSIKAASEGIDAAKKVVEQMKSVANTAAQDASTSASTTTAIETKGRVDAVRQLPTATSSDAPTSDDTTLLTNLNNYTTGAKIDIRVGDTMTLAHDTNAISTFTVTGTSTMQDLQEFVDDLVINNVAANGALDMTASILASGKLQVALSATNAVSSNDNIVIGGTVAVALGISTTLATTTGGTTTGTIVLGSGPSYLEDSDAAHRIAALTDVDGKMLGLEYGDTLTMQYGDNGEVATFTIGFDDTIDDVASAAAGLESKAGYGQTIEDLDAWIDAQTSVTGSITSTGQIKFETTNSSDQGYTLGGTLVDKMGLGTAVAANGGTLTGTVKMYVADQSDTPTAEATTLIRDISRANGEVIRALANTTDVNAGAASDAYRDVTPGETVTVQTTTGTDTIRIGNGWTVQSLMDAITAVDSGLTVTLNGTGQLIVNNQTAGTVTFGGTVGNALFNNSDPQTDKAFDVNVTGSEQTSAVVMYAAFGTAAGSTTSGVPSNTYISQFDTLHTQLDKLVEDASYQGTNLIAGTSGSPLNVVFNEAASNANKLEIAAVDMTTTGLGIKVATGTWTDTTAVETAIESLTASLTTLRDQSSTFGQNLTLVKTRQDFANNIIATLNEGADKLTLADMNEEGANMLALQTRSQLGTQSLALASQANASVLRLFG